MPEIQKADPAARRRSLLMISIAAIIGVTVVVLFEQYRSQLEDLLERNVDFLIAHPELIAIIVLALMIPIIAAAFYLWYFGTSIILAKRFPPPGVAVARDTLILSGTKAINRGRVMQVLAVSLLVACLAFPVAMWYLLWTLGRTS
jgi:ABC-type dipeptide/oligopeptide/nickel transport system permease subunit